MPTVIPGKLKLKGASSDTKKKKKKRSREEREESSSGISTTKATDSSISAGSNPDEFLTESQKKFEQKRIKTELDKAKKIVGTTYRDRVEQLNYELSIKSEHNDIPRISAAGNG
eukprot:CAMPEP_0114470598 /NCGR_PEP_ID=MMETSP0104-20121206/11353_1 /TAXON_ID=37642 ORGANISM="Paraphysomonas imperforata, Strain PA2" /NCGR_SAMPLE_ID=MMETSP0104 /ASSEMBLY_ACC=CAM_ASM_000202 /LENGTH=113 /DNA_ID=CAMNT_0001644365 /DNA_START=21 /DNA_END=362 /DNA_ORIENTATION=-